TVFAGDFHIDGDGGDGLYPVFGGEAGVEARAASQNEDGVDIFEDAPRLVAKEFGRDSVDILQGVGDGARLFKDLLLHVVAVRAELGRATVCKYGVHDAFDGAAAGIGDPDAAYLQVGNVAVFEIDDLVGCASQGEGVGREVVGRVAQADDQRRALAGGGNAVGLVAAEGRDGVGALQPAYNLLQGFEQVVGVQVIQQV